MNQYASWTTSSGTVLQVQYNTRGDTTSDGLFTYGYDAMDRLTSAEDPNHLIKVDYAYDAQGHLISRTEETGWDAEFGLYASSVTTTFAYDGDRLIAQLDSQGHVLKSYQWGLGMNGKVGALLSITDFTNPNGAQTYTTVYDGQGNLVNLLDQNQLVVANYVYSAFGKLLSATGPAAGVCDIGWQTMYQDPVTGLDFADLRVYHPQLGRWMTPDPIGVKGGDIPRPGSTPPRRLTLVAGGGHGSRATAWPSPGTRSSKPERSDALRPPCPGMAGPPGRSVI